MACLSVRSSFRELIRDAANTSHDVPFFLAPAILRTSQPRSFSTTPRQSSRIGSAEISIPPEVSLRFFDLPRSKLKSRNPDAPSRAVELVGPLGQITLPLPAYLNTDYNEEGKKVAVSVQDAEDAHQKAMWGTMRAHLQNSVAGVSEGHVCILRMVGVGYRATIENSAITKQPTYPGQQFVSLKLGYAHPIELGVPKGVKATTPQPTRILLEGCDKQVVAEFAAKIREWRKPEPYKGKGIFVNDETIRVKPKKIK